MILMAKPAKRTLIATVEATPNIALVKYWGKRNEERILPMEGSISVTMDEQLKTRTTVMFSEKFKEDEAWLDNKKLEGKELGEITKQLDVLRKRAGVGLKARFVSINGFPTAAGLASSASGLAALACAGAKALGLELSEHELSVLARMGSGSACRSVLGGFVEWKRGEREDGSDSHAVQIAPVEHWPEIRNVIALVGEGRKKVSSRAGMRQTVATSPLYRERIRTLPGTIKTVREAILKRDLPTLLEATMRESNNMHAVMLDTWPPITYLNDVSKEIIHATHALNESEGKTIAGYTFDAGPHANIYTTQEHVPKVRKMLEGIPGVAKVIVCGPGSGPKYLAGKQEHLIDPVTAEVRRHHYDAKSNKIVVEA
jgi:diphosphomevalonate decarboxylase